MRKTITIVALMAIIYSCGSNESKDTSATTTTTSTPATNTAPAANPEADKGMELVVKNDCLGCHKIEEKLNGPAYREIANKYAGQPGIADTLASHIIKGHVGTWGDVAMTPHPNLSEADAKTMVTYILSLKQ